MTETFPIEGYAAIYDEVDLNGDIIAPGAFARSLAQTGAAFVKLLYQHVAEQPIGRWLRFEERAKGLYAHGELFLATQTARETAELIRADIIDGLSIGFRTVKAHKANGARRISEADLWEVSIVTFPMAPNARLIRAGADREPILAFADGVRRAARILSA
jgi:HK97 family phage prohead protease